MEDTGLALATIDWTSALSLLIAATTLVVVLVQERRHRMRVAAANWDADTIGTTKNPETGATQWVVKLEQEGSHTVTVRGLWSFGCRVQHDMEYRLKSRTFRPGDKVELMFEAENVEAGWILLHWQSLEDRRKGGYEWMPISITSPLSERLWEQRRQELARSRWQRMRQRQSDMLRRVGPDHFAYRRQPTSRRLHRRLGSMAHGVLQEEIAAATGAIR